MKDTSKVNGFEVRVYLGREITLGEFEKLSPEERQKVVVKTNGPHHNAKWANGGYSPPSTLSALVRGTRIHAGMERHFKSAAKKGHHGGIPYRLRKYLNGKHTVEVPS